MSFDLEKPKELRTLNWYRQFADTLDRPHATQVIHELVDNVEKLLLSCGDVNTKLDQLENFVDQNASIKNVQFVSDWERSIKSIKSATYYPFSGYVESGSEDECPGASLKQQFILLDDGKTIPVCTKCHQYVIENGACRGPKCDDHEDLIVMGDTVEVPEPEEDDIWNYSFVGTTMTKKPDRNGKWLIGVEDKDGNVFDVEENRLTKL